MNLAQILNQQLFELSGTSVTPASILTFAVIVLVSYWISAAVQRVVARMLTRSGFKDPGTISTIRKLLHYAILLVGFAVGMQTVGISLASIFAAGAVVAVAVGFALQNVLQNFVSGIILLAERSITERDVLQVEGRQVVVEKLGTRATVARTLDDDEIIIPNSVLVQSTVTNLTLADDLQRIRARVGVAYGSDMDQVQSVLCDAGRTVEAREMAHEPQALLIEFGDSSVVWEVSIRSSDPWSARRIRSELNMAIWRHLQAAGIVIAFPQLDLHVVQEPGLASTV